MPTISRGVSVLHLSSWPHARPTFTTFYYFVTETFFLVKKLLLLCGIFSIW